MAGELQLQTSPVINGNLYAIVRNSLAQPWNTNTVAFESFTTGNYTHYAIGMTEQGSSGYYVGDFPTAITVAGVYGITVYQRAGDSPAVSDTAVGTGQIIWDGNAEASPTGSNLSSLSYVKTALQITSTDFDVVLSQFITAVSTKFTTYLNGRQLVAQDYTEIRNGHNTNYIKVNNYPINSLTQIAFGLNDTSTTTIDSSQFVWDEATGIIRFKRVSSQSQPFQGFQNIRIDYNGGFTEIPADVQEAVAIQCLKLLNLYNQKSFAVSSKRVGDVEISYADPYRFAADYPLLGEVKAMLNPYKDQSY